eukprot:347463-Alexandrium_andersonii.AAC.1
MAQALEVAQPGHARWVDVGLHGAKEQFAPNILREGLDTKYSAGKERRTHTHSLGAQDPARSEGSAGLALREHRGGGSGPPQAPRRRCDHLQERE